MTNYITAAEFTSITGVTAAEAGESGPASTTIRDAEITKAQLEFEKDVGRSFAGTETDYITAQEAVAWMTAHRLAVRKYGLLAETEAVQLHKSEYLRLLRLLKTSETKDEKTEQRIFEGKIDTVEVEERYNESP